MMSLCYYAKYRAVRDTLSCSIHELVALQNIVNKYLYLICIQQIIPVQVSNEKKMSTHLYLLGNQKRDKEGKRPIKPPQRWEKIVDQGGYKHTRRQLHTTAGASRIAVSSKAKPRKNKTWIACNPAVES